MPIDSWEELQAAWLTDNGEGDAALQRTVNLSRWRSYILALFNLAALFYMIWELSTLAIAEGTIMWIAWTSITAIGITVIAVWRLYLRLSFARGLSLNLRDNMDFMLRRAVSNQRLAMVTLVSAGFFVIVLFSLVLIGLRDTAVIEFFDLKRVLGIGLLLTAISIMAITAFRRRSKAFKEADALRTIQKFEILENAHPEL